MILGRHELGGVTDVASGQGWSTEDLAREVRARCAVFDAWGMGAGDVAVLAHGGTPAFFADLLALWETGVAAACVDPSLPAPALEKLTGLVRPAVVLVDAPGLSRRDDSLQVPVFSTSADEGQPGRGGGKQRAGLDDHALILFTSGSTGTPKGVVHSFRSILARLALNVAEIGHSALERTLCVLPTHFGHGLIGNCLTPLYSGGRLFLQPGMGVKTASGLGELLDTHGIRFLSSVPALWRLVCKTSRPPASATLRRVHVGSAPLSAVLWRRVAEWAGTDRVYNTYGITEAANWVGGASVHQGAIEDGLVGRLWGGSAAVLDDNQQVLDEGEGEILLRTPSLMNGYFARDDLSRQALFKGWFRTGDLGCVDAEGVIRLRGRIKFEINRAGVKVQPEEVELLLECHPGVAEACAFAVPDVVCGETVGVAVRLADDAHPSRAELRDWCSVRVRRECVPEKWFFITNLPRSDRGKVSRDVVKRLCEHEVAAP